jgi:hypothetical protein
VLGGLAAHVIAIAFRPVPAGVRRGHGPLTGGTAQQPLEHEAELIADVGAARDLVLPQEGLHALEQLRVHDRRVLAGVDLALVAGLARVGHVGEQAVQRGAGEGQAAALLAFAVAPALAGPAAPGQLLDHRQQALPLQVQQEDGADLGRLVLVDQQLAAPGVDVVAQQRVAPGPLPFPPGGGDLVAGPLGDDLPLELREREQHVEDQPAHRRGRVELLRDRRQGDPVRLEQLHHPGEVQQRAAEPVDLVDDHAVHLARLDVGQQALQGGAVGVPPP